MRDTIPKILAAIGKVRSLSEGRRLTFMGGVSINGVVVKDISQVVSINTGDIIEVGKTEIVVPAEIAEINNGNHSDVSTNPSDPTSE